jgi:hypothetical protein
MFVDAGFVLERFVEPTVDDSDPPLARTIVGDDPPDRVI